MPPQWVVLLLFTNALHGFAAAQSTTELAQKANGLYDEGNTHYAQHSRGGELRAMQLYMEGLQAARQSGDQRAVGRGEFLMGAAYDAGGRTTDALNQYKAAYAIFRQLNDDCWQVNCLQGVSVSFAKQAQADSARHYYNLAKASVRQCRDYELKVRVLCYEIHDPAFYGSMQTSDQDSVLREVQQIVSEAWADNSLPKLLKVEIKRLYLNAEAIVAERRQNIPRLIEFRMRLDTLLNQPEDINRVTNYQILIRFLRAAGRYQEALHYTDSVLEIFHRNNAADVAAATNLGTAYQAQLAAERALRAEQDLSRSQWLVGVAVAITLVVGGLAVGLLQSNRRRRRINNQLRASQAEKDVLLHELHHRVKNNLQMLSTMLTMQASRLEEGQARDVVLQSRRRVDAIASVHRNLHSGEITATINLADFLEELTTNLSSDTSQMVSVEMKLDFVEAKQDVAVPLGILVNELITNSIKHAMGADGHLKLYLELKRTGHNQVQVVYADSGQGLPFALTTNIKGHFGLRLIQLMASQLEADLHIEGSTWRFHFPLDTTPT